jgi:hypothetical protein
MPEGSLSVEEMSHRGRASVERIVSLRRRRIAVSARDLDAPIHQQFDEVAGTRSLGSKRHHRDRRDRKEIFGELEVRVQDRAGIMRTRAERR